MNKTKDNAEKTRSEWFPSAEEYSPQLSVQDWIGLLADETVFTAESLVIMKRIKDFGGMATCKQLSLRYGSSPNFYNSGSSALARRVVHATNCPTLAHNTENSKWWPILYVGKRAPKGADGIYIWKLRPELSEALDQVDLSTVPLYENDAIAASTSFWWLSISPESSGFSDAAVGETVPYPITLASGKMRHGFDKCGELSAGDHVLICESGPRSEIVAIGRIASEQSSNRIFLEKREELIEPIDGHIMEGTHEFCSPSCLATQQSGLFKLTEDQYNSILDTIRERNPLQVESAAEVYTKEDFLEEVYMTDAQYSSLAGVLRHKRNVILQGAPGVGKTYAAKRLAYAFMGEKDDARIEFVQFHASYSYEDFVLGYKPDNDGFKLKRGVFYRFCRQASNQPDKDFFFIIDEINRGNLSKIFGELLLLIERDYRGAKATLAYSGQSFYVPSNLYIIGMMNTADRSLAMIDYALRRRFSFVEMEPGFDSTGFVRYQKTLNSSVFDTLISRVKELNSAIARDRSLGKGFCIGHSYFCGQTDYSTEWLRSIVDFEIIPMLSEYWFDEPTKLDHWRNTLQGVFSVQE